MPRPAQLRIDLLTTTFDDDGFFQNIRKRGLGADIGVGHQDRKFDRIHEATQHFGTIVEFMVADCHAVIAELVHHLGSDLALVVGVIKRALELVATIYEDAVVAAGTCLGKGGHQTGGAAKALALGIVALAAAAVIFADRSDGWSWDSRVSWEGAASRSSPPLEYDWP